MKKDQEKLIFLDTETTGVGDTDRICQVGYKNNGTIHESLFKPPVPMTVDAMSVNHVTDEMLENAKPFKGSEFEKVLQKSFDDDFILVAHNAEFDMKFLLKEGMMLPRRYICTMKVAHHHDKEALLEKHNLQYLRYLWKLKFDIKINPHEAVADVIVLEKLFEYYLEFYTIAEMVEISSKPILFKKMTFGKYKGRWFREIAKADLDYLLWMRRAMEMDENMRHTVEYWINNRNLK